LRHHRIIRPILAGWLLALFALAITPKNVIHALVAHHTDSHLRPDRTTDQFNNAGFHCDTENLVVEFPFIPGSVSLYFAPRPSYPVYRPAGFETPIAFSHPLFGLRGPPAFFCA
jgi:hypothetical protein